MEIWRSCLGGLSVININIFKAESCNRFVIVITVIAIFFWVVFPLWGKFLLIFWGGGGGGGEIFPQCRVILVSKCCIGVLSSDM